MAYVPGHRERLTVSASASASASLQPYPQRQLSMTLEPPVHQDMDSSERAAVVAQWATLLQATGLQTGY